MTERRLWILIVCIAGLAIGISVPTALQSNLEAYALPLLGIIFVAIFVMLKKITFSDRACWIAFLAFLSLYSLYPHYIALRISGLPWISPIRLTLAVLFFTWLYAVRQSPVLYPSLVRHVRENRLFFIFLATFLLAQVMSLATARDPGQAITKFLLAQFTWTFPFLATLALVRTDRRVQVIAILFIGFAAAQCLVGFMESRLERLVWLDYLPPGFGADNEALLRMFAGQFRGGIYRVQGSFTVSLIYAEFLVLMLPFAALTALDGKTRLVRLAGAATTLAILPAQLLSGSRLGIVGTIVIGLLMLLLHVTRIMRTNKRSMLGPFLALLLPFALAAFAVAYVSSNRLQTLTIGGGQHQASTDSRFEQVMMGIPRVLERPIFGHGVGLGAEALGFRGPSGILTIDSYALSLILEVGIVGLVAFFGMIGVAIFTGVRLALDPGGGRNYLGGAVALSLTGFLFTKLVLSQAETNVLVFIMMGYVLALRAQAAQTTSALLEVEVSPAAPVGPSLKKSSGSQYTRMARRPERAIGRTVTRR